MLSRIIRPNRFNKFVRYYHQNVIDHFNNPRNVGSFPKDDKNVGTGLVGAPACGDVLKLQIKVDPETGEITESKFLAFGCGSAIAASSVVSEWVKGQNVNTLNITNKEIASHLKLPPVKLHCSMLAEDALKSAIEDFNKKKEEKNEN